MNGKDLLTIFPDFVVCSGHKGLNVPISNISVVDAPDIPDWMKGNEFVITSGYIFKDCPEKLADLILRLKSKNIAAFGIKLSRFIKKLPDIVIETSNKIDLPIIDIPNKYAFYDVINPTLTKILHSQYDELIKCERIHDEFIKLGSYNTDINNVLECVE